MTEPILAGNVRGGALGRVLAALAMVVACAGCDSFGTVRIASEWTQPGETGSIGGYAYFGRLVDTEGRSTEFELARPYRADLPPGTYQLEIWTVSQSDEVGVEIVPGGTSRIHRSFGGIDSKCTQDVTVGAGAVVDLVYRAGIGSCEIVPS